MLTILSNGLPGTWVARLSPYHVHPTLYLSGIFEKLDFRSYPSATLFCKNNLIWFREWSRTGNTRKGAEWRSSQTKCIKQRFHQTISYLKVVAQIPTYCSRYKFHMKQALPFRVDCFSKHEIENEQLQSFLMPYSALKASILQRVGNIYALLILTSSCLSDSFPDPFIFHWNVCFPVHSFTHLFTSARRKCTNGGQWYFHNLVSTIDYFITLLKQNFPLQIILYITLHRAYEQMHLCLQVFSLQPQLWQPRHEATRLHFFRQLLLDILHSIFLLVSTEFYNFHCSQVFLQFVHEIKRCSIGHRFSNYFWTYFVLFNGELLANRGLVLSRLKQVLAHSIR